MVLVSFCEEITEDEVCVAGGGGGAVEVEASEFVPAMFGADND
jgi:hypothetical protein